MRLLVFFLIALFLHSLLLLGYLWQKPLKNTAMTQKPVERLTINLAMQSTIANAKTTPKKPINKLSSNLVTTANVVSSKAINAKTSPSKKPKQSLLKKPLLKKPLPKKKSLPKKLQKSVSRTQLIAKKSVSQKQQMPLQQINSAKPYKAESSSQAHSKNIEKKLSVTEPAIATKNGEQSEFDNKIRQHLLANKSQFERRIRQYGEVIVEFSLDRKGNVLDLKIGKTSSIQRIDKAALKLTKQAAPFPKALNSFDWQQRRYRFRLIFQK